MVGLGRLELPTSRLSGVRSNHLSYRPQEVRPAARARMGGAPVLVPALGSIASDTGILRKKGNVGGGLPAISRQLAVERVNRNGR